MNAKRIVFLSIATVATALLLAGLPIAQERGKAGELAPNELVSTMVRVSVASDGTEANDGSAAAAISADGRYVAFMSHSTNLVDGDTNGYWDYFVQDRDTDADGIFDETGAISTTLVSVSSSGEQANYEFYYYERYLAISADGRYVAFISRAGNLVEGDTNGAEDIFIRDLQTRQTTRVSVHSNGAQANDASMWPSISADGRYVAFSSKASNLIGSDIDGDHVCELSEGCDTNGGEDVFVHDRQTGQTRRVSIRSDGGQVSGGAHPAISADGRYVAFSSSATNLVEGDTNGWGDVFVHDRQTGQTTRVSVHTNGTQANHTSSMPVISADGRSVAFVSQATNLVDGDTNGQVEVFVRDRLLGETRRVAIEAEGGLLDHPAILPAISGDGRYVAFETDSQLVPEDLKWWRDIYVRDLQMNKTARVSENSNGEEGDNPSREASISLNGCYVAFTSSATNLVPDDTNYYVDIFVRNICKSILVNSTGDASDNNLADEECDTGSITPEGTPECTLRAAIENSNQGYGSIIRFDIPSTSGFPTISPASPLPDIIRPVQINGNWQPHGMVELDGSNAGADANGLNITAGNSLVQGLIINRFGGNGIRLADGSGNTVRGCYIGVDRTGLLDQGNDRSGILITNSSSNIIGGTGELERNIISGNGLAGVMIMGSGSINNLLQNNYLGVDKNGSAAIKNDWDGVLVSDAQYTLIGGTDPLQRNIISGNYLTGVTISGTTAQGTRLQNNYIGLDKTGSLAIKNENEGVRINGAPDTRIGGTDPLQRNIISGNGLAGISILASGAERTIIEGNYIGLKADGVGNLGNGGAGIEVIEPANHTVIGGQETGAGNRIAFNEKEGIAIVGFSDSNGILSNSIHSNQGMGIDLGRDGITANDVGDVDIGANRRQNFPIFTDMYVWNGKIVVQGVISSTAETGFRIEVFSNDTFSAQGDIQGKDLRAAATVFTDEKGWAEFDFQLPDIGTTHTATATELGPLDEPVRTSEFTPIDIAILEVEVTQSVQDVSNSIPLVAVKPTYALVHVRALGAVEINNIQARLTGYRGESKLGTIYPLSESVKIVRVPHRKLMNLIFFFPLPGEWIYQPGSLTLEAEVNYEPRQVQEADYSNNKMSAAVTIQNEPWLRMRLIDVTAMTNITGTENTLFLPDPQIAAGMENVVKAMYPIPTLYIERGLLILEDIPFHSDYVPFSELSALLQVNYHLAKARSFDRLVRGTEADWVYYGIVADYLGGQADPVFPVASSGLGAKDSTLRWVVDTCAHETGHIFGRWHTCTPEGKEPWCDKKYPHYQGAISDPTDGEPFSEYSWYVFQGFDITQPSNLGPIQAFDTKDIMSYNPGGRWISDYTYLGIMNYRNQTLSTDAASSMVQAPGTYLLASGLISVTQNTATFGPLYQIPNAPGQTLPTPGDYSLRLLDSDGATLADYPFAAAPALEFPPEAEPVAIFSLVMPSIEGTTQVQVISGTQVLATQLASSHAPTITLTTAPPAGETVSGTLPISWTASDEDGDDLSYVVFYSADDGQTWTTQTTDWISDTFKLYTQALPGSQQARVRVLVSDGFYIAQATSAAFTVAPHSPEPFIFLPEENGEYPVGALVSLQGSAYDREDGSLSGASLTWTSSVDGNIGTDSTLYLTNLSPGLHTITLTATDSDAMSASASVNIYIGSAVYLPVIMR